MKTWNSLFGRIAAVILALALVPLSGISLFAYSQAKTRMTRDVVSYFLEKVAADTAEKITRALRERVLDVRLLMEVPTFSLPLRRPDDDAARERLVRLLDAVCTEKRVYDIIAVFDVEGRLVATNLTTQDGRALDPAAVDGAFKGGVASEPWFVEAVSGRLARQDWHQSPYAEAIRREPSDDPAAHRHIGFAGPLHDPDTHVVAGVLYVLVSWTEIQDRILDSVREYFGSPEFSGQYETGYAFLFKEDGDTIIGHENRSLYGTRLIADHGLESLHGAVVTLDYGHIQYQYPPGTPKIAGFRTTRAPDEPGFGWIVGVGIDNREIFRTVDDLGTYLVVTTVTIGAAVVAAAYFLAHRIVTPLRSLTAFTAEVARGNLGARTEIRTGDEIGELARAFNRMTEELEVSREKIVRAEKDAAWREMARQVAHEIKNPLTPMKLSTQHCLRAHADGAPDFGEILRKSMGTISRQIDTLQKIAAEFSDFARMPSRDLRPVAVGDVLRECVELYETGPDGPLRFRCTLAKGVPDVLADRDELRRVFINLISNAAQAMNDRGEIDIVAEAVKGVSGSPGRDAVEVRISDRGSGIPDDVLPRLFQPYFSTKSRGTGLGLAICRRVVGDLGGDIRLESRRGVGTTATVRLPAASGVSGRRREEA